MQRTIFDEDHAAFRASAKEYCDRTLIPRMEEFLEAKTLPRDIWLEAGKQGFLGLDVPEEYGGSSVGDYRFNAIFAEELSKVSASLSSCFGIHYDCSAPYFVDLGTEEQKQRWLPKFCSVELVTKAEVTQAYVDNGVVAHSNGELSAIDAAKAKWWSAQVQNEILDACVQLYGGYGYMNEYRVARAWRDARVTKIWAGSNEIMKELIGRDLGL